MMSIPLVYLAGPIAGQTYAGAVDWREALVVELAALGIKGLSPMRAKRVLIGVDNLQAVFEDYGSPSPLMSARGTMSRDRWDVTRCDVLLVNLLGATRVSIGSIMEIAWAHLKGIPVVGVIEPEGNPHEHIMVQHAIDFRTSSIEEAIDTLKGLLL